jgi:hypothetical protein
MFLPQAALVALGVRLAQQVTIVHKELVAAQGPQVITYQVTPM